MGSDVRFTAVIGANYGDEGKGSAVDRLCSLNPHRTIVIKHNGGDQAGHTVTAEGKRFVFSQLGSGSIAGSSTWLAPTFLFNPISFAQEVEDFTSLFGRKPPKIYIHPECQVVLPLDILIGQKRERKLRHGSCGHGINEAVTRVMAGGSLTIGTLLRLTPPQLADHLSYLVQGWGAYRAHSQGVKFSLLDVDISEMSRQVMTGVEKIMSAKVAWLAITPSAPDSSVNHYVFEGAQGLALDEVRGKFPHVTRSRTGLTNPVNFARQIHYGAPLTPHYVTRCYLTRHGKGPLKHGDAPERWAPGFKDATNFDNPWQGSLRAAPLGRELFDRIKLDLSEANIPQAAATLEMTCLDQVADGKFLFERTRYDASPIGVKELVYRNSGISNVVCKARADRSAYLVDTVSEEVYTEAA